MGQVHRGVTPRSAPLIQADDSPRLPQYPSLGGQTFTVCNYIIIKMKSHNVLHEHSNVADYYLLNANISLIRNTINKYHLCNGTIWSILPPPFKLNSFRRPKTDHLILSQEKEAYNHNLANLFTGGHTGCSRRISEEAY